MESKNDRFGFRPSEEFFDHLNVELLRKKFTHLSVAYLKERAFGTFNEDEEIDYSTFPSAAHEIIFRLTELTCEHRSAYWAITKGHRSSRVNDQKLRKTLPANFLKIMELFCDNLWIPLVELYEEFEGAEAFCFRRKKGYSNWNVGQMHLRTGGLPSL